MDNYEEDNKLSLEVFSSFVEKTKAAAQALIENIKENIKNFEIEINNTTKDAHDNEDSIKKCENEITRKTSEIEMIRESIENVQGTYKKIVDAYSSTSRGETKNLYSEVIENAKRNCDEETDKYQEEISTLTADIEAINGNIKEFTQTGKDLEALIDKYTQELEKYKKALSFVNETVGKYTNRLDNINNNIIQTKREKGKPLNFGYTYYRPSELNSNVEHYNLASAEPKEKFEEPNLENTTSFEESLKQIYDLTGYTPKETPKKEEETEVEQEEIKDVEVNEEALKAEEFQIDVAEEVTPKEEETKEEAPKKEQKKKEEEPQEEETEEEPKAEVKEEEEEDSLDSDEIDEWEKILDSADDMLTNLNKATDETPATPKVEEKAEVKEETPKVPEEPKAEITPPQPEAPVIEQAKAPIEPPKEEPKAEASQAAPDIIAPETDAAVQASNKEAELNKETLEQLLKPYGTTYDKLSKLVNNKYTLKDGTEKTFELTTEDVIKAINAIDGNDLKKMKVVGPEITILKKVKSMKEGK